MWKCNELHQYKTKRKELDPPEVEVNATTIPPLTTTIMATVEVSVYCIVLYITALLELMGYSRPPYCAQSQSSLIRKLI